MDAEQLEFIEKYQILYEESPNSKVFAPLSEAYRRAGMLKEALEVSLHGVKLHPKFAGGQLALARIFLDQNELEKASHHLNIAVSCSPENILAISLLAETQIKTRKPKEALNTYKMLLFLNPANPKALKAVKKLESISADEFDDELFEMKPVKQAVEAWEKLDFEELDPDADTGTKERSSYFLERFISLIDAFLTRNDIDRALETLNEAEQQFGPIDELVKRRRLLSSTEPTKSEDSPLTNHSLPSREELAHQDKAKYLQTLLNRIEERRTR